MFAVTSAILTEIVCTSEISVFKEVVIKILGK